jgi:hypothetical protein
MPRHQKIPAVPRETPQFGDMETRKIEIAMVDSSFQNTKPHEKCAPRPLGSVIRKER